ncbi:MAG: hypothetical protein GY906_24930 [bacterium]|nr:hypothetical protein [bacterium]
MAGSLLHATTPVSKKKTNPKTLPIVKNFGRKNYGTTVGQQVVGLSDLEEHDAEVGVRPNPPMGKRSRRKRKRA